MGALQALDTTPRTPAAIADTLAPLYQLVSQADGLNFGAQHRLVDALGRAAVADLTVRDLLEKLEGIA